MTSRISLNIHGQNIPDRVKLFQHLEKLRPVAVVVMDDVKTAADIKSLLPDTTVIFRFNGDRGDGDLHMRYTPQEWLDKMLAKLGGDKRIMLATTNEPTLTRRLIKWHEDLIPLANAAGVSLCVLNLATGNPKPEEWELARPLLELLAVHRQHVMGLHEYSGGVITSGLIGGYPDNAGKAPGTPGGLNLIPPQNWPTDVSNVTRYHMGRFKFLTDYCAAQHIKPPRIILSEHGFDDTSDIKPWLDTLRKTSPYASIRGWRTLVNQWRVWFPVWNADQAYFEQLRWANETIYRDSPVEAQCLFCWGNSGGWEGFDLSGAGDFQKLLETYAQETPSVPQSLPHYNDPRWTPAVNRSGDSYRVRLQAFIDDTVELAWIESGDAFHYIPNVETNEFLFVKTKDGVIGFSHRDILKVEIADPPPVIVTPPPHVDFAMMFRQHREVYQVWIDETKRELQPLLDEKHALDNRVNNLQKRIEAYEMLLDDYVLIEEFVNAATKAA